VTEVHRRYELDEPLCVAMRLREAESLEPEPQLTDEPAEVTCRDCLMMEVD